jgi:phenylacetate-CoA ligase
MDPMGRFAAIAPPADIPRQVDGQECPVGTTCYLDLWMLVGRDYVTGDCCLTNHRLGVDEHLAWLAQRQPQYLRSQSATLEQLAFSATGPIGSLAGVVAISQQLTDEMETLIEASLKVPVHITYGLNELGLVGVRCPEGHRYHVFAENVWLEILGDDDQLVSEGEVGRVVLSGLTNRAMPLLRYDTGDMARRIDSPCPCGRTLPSFIDLQGRYRRLVNLPAGTWGHYGHAGSDIDDACQCVAPAKAISIAPVRGSLV